MPGDSSASSTVDDAFRIGEWLVEPLLDRVSRDGVTHKLEPRTMRLLVRLADDAGKVVSSQELLDSVWSGVVVGPASVYQAISQLRKLFGDDEASPAYIATVPRRGYRLVAPIQRGAASATEPRAQGAASTIASAASAPARRALATRTTLATIAIVAGVAAVAAVAAVWIGTRQPRLPEHRELRPAAAAAMPTNLFAMLPILERSAGGKPFCAPAVTHLVFDRLAAIRDLQLISLGSTQRYTTADFDPAEIASRLHARHLLQGSVSCTDDVVQLDMELIALPSGARLWSTAFDRPPGEISGMREDIARRVVASLAIDGALLSPAGRAPVVLEAYQLYAEGIALIDARLSVPQTEKAAALFTRATTLDPAFARAYVAIGDALAWGSSLRGNLAGPMTPTQAANVTRAFQRALELDPALGQAWVGLARVTTDRTLAEQHYRKGLEFSPNYTVGSLLFAWFLSEQGRVGEGMHVLEAARRRDPNSALLNWVNAQFLMDSRSDVPGSQRLLEEALVLDPDFHPARLELARLQHFHHGEFARACAVYEATGITDDSIRSGLAYLYLDLDDLGAAVDVWTSGPRAPAFMLPVISTYRGDTQAAAAVSSQVLKGEHRHIHGLAARSVRDHAVVTGDFDAALALIQPAFQRLQESGTQHNFDRLLGIVYASTLLYAGRKLEGEELARTLIAASKGDEVGRPAGWFARERASLHALLGESELALQELAVSQQAGEWAGWWYTADRDPTLRSLRSDPRFRALADRAKRHRGQQRALLEELRRKGEIPRRG
jgi:DNA-binding winged helix-turn-helix (wHTH) protein/TolB-like protein/tetratricopeptide (TPR) repeat protein